MPQMGSSPFETQSGDALVSRGNGSDPCIAMAWPAHLETTQVYAHADTEHKGKAIAAATPANNPLYSKLNSTRFTVSDDETLKRLTGLR